MTGLAAATVTYTCGWPGWADTSSVDADGLHIRHTLTAPSVPTADVSLEDIGGSDEGLMPVRAEQVEHVEISADGITRYVEPVEIWVGPLPYALDDAVRLHAALTTVLAAVMPEVAR